MTQTDRRVAILARLVIPLAGLLATALLTLLSMRNPAGYKRVMVALIEWPGEKPFKDWAVTPAVLSCWAKGVIVYLPNDCSPTFNYSPVMLLLPAPPGGPFWNIVFGFSIALVFFAVLGLLAPPRSRFEFAVRLMATLSPGVALGIERGNLDMILFILLLVGSLAIARRSAISVAGYGVFIFAALCKFYPVAALLLLVRERPTRFVVIGLLTLAALAWLFFGFSKELAIILNNLPDSGEWTMEFKGRAMTKWITTGITRIGTIRPYATAVEASLRLVFVALMAGAALAIWRACAARGIRLPDRQTTLLPMLMGATVTLFCFLVGQNYIYREVYILPILPGLFVIAGTAPPASGRVVKVICLVIATGLWMPLIRWSAVQLGLWNDAAIRGVLWFGYELGWWCIATALSAILIAFFRTSMIGKVLLGALPGARLAAAG